MQSSDAHLRHWLDFELVAEIDLLGSKDRSRRFSLSVCLSLLSDEDVSLTYLILFIMSASFARFSFDFSFEWDSVLTDGE